MGQVQQMYPPNSASWSALKTIVGTHVGHSALVDFSNPNSPQAASGWSPTTRWVACYAISTSSTSGIYSPVTTYSNSNFDYLNQALSVSQNNLSLPANPANYYAAAGWYIGGPFANPGQVGSPNYSLNSENFPNIVQGEPIYLVANCYAGTTVGASSYTFINSSNYANFVSAAKIPLTAGGHTIIECQFWDFAYAGVIPASPPPSPTGTISATPGTQTPGKTVNLNWNITP